MVENVHVNFYWLLFNGSPPKDPKSNPHQEDVGSRHTHPNKQQQITTIAISDCTKEIDIMSTPTTFWRLAGLSYTQVRPNRNVERRVEKTAKNRTESWEIIYFCRLRQKDFVQIFLHIHLWTTFPFYLHQFVTRAASTVRASLKEPAKTKAMANETFSYNAAPWSAGKSQGKTNVSELGKAGLA